MKNGGINPALDFHFFINIVMKNGGINPALDFHFFMWISPKFQLLLVK